MKAKIYHNPRCSKSRQALELLEHHGVQIEEIRYLDTPPSKAQLKALLQALDLSAQHILRFTEARAKQLGLSRDDKRTQAQWLELLSQNPELIERPIIVVGNKAVVGRPPENVLQLLN